MAEIKESRTKIRWNIMVNNGHPQKVGKMDLEVLAGYDLVLGSSGASVPYSIILYTRRDEENQSCLPDQWPKRP